MCTKTTRNQTERYERDRERERDTEAAADRKRENDVPTESLSR